MNAKKTATKKPANKATTKKKAAIATKPGDCPRGGKHQWAEENGERFCSKCQEPAPAQAKKAKAAKPVKDKEQKLSALDAAAKVLESSKEPMNCGELIEAMAKKGLWTSPGGKTPAATLYSAILREINVKGKESRFKKTERGRFAAA